MQNTDPNGSLKQQQTLESGTVATPVVSLPSTTFQQFTLADHLQAFESAVSVGLVQDVQANIEVGTTTIAYTVPTQSVLSSQVPNPPTVAARSPIRNVSSVSGVSAGSVATSLTVQQAVTALQRQLSSQGLAGLTNGAPQPPASITATLQQPLVAVVSSHSDGRQMQQNVYLATTTSISTSPSGGTIYHHGQSPVRGTPPLSNLQQNIIGMNVNQQSQVPQKRPGSAASASTAVSPVMSRVVLDTRQMSLGTIASTTRNISGGPPKKKIKLEEKPPATPEIAHQRKILLEHKRKEMQEIKENYIEHLTELFFLQSGRNVMEYLPWKKRPTPQLVNFLKSENLDSDEEEEHLQEKRINDEVKVLTTSGSNVPLATPIAISTTLPPSVSALSQQGVDSKANQGRPPSSLALSVPVSTGHLGLSMATSTMSDGTVNTTALSTQLQLQLAKNDTKPLLTGGITQSIKTPVSTASNKPSLSAVYDNSIGSQEAIVERAKQEAQVMQRVADLRKTGLWSARRLPKVQEPPRNKGHWDYLLEEMTWLAADFVQERKWKKACARKISNMVSKHFRELEQKELKAEKEEAQKLKKIAGQMTKIIKEFWTNIEKVVQYKQQSRLEEKRKKALDMHLNFIVDQTEKYSTWLTAGLQGGESVMSSVGDSVATSPDHSSDVGDDMEFRPVGTASDDEETIEKEEIESGMDEEAEKKELEALHQESELPIEELLRSLPEEVLAKPATIEPLGDKDDETTDDKKKGSDGEFSASGSEEDVEETIEEEEKLESTSYKEELKDLEDEGEMSIEELRKKYAGAYDSDFEMPEDSEEEESSSENDSDDDIEAQSDEESTTEYEEDSEREQAESDVGLEFLLKPESAAKTIMEPKKESDNIAEPRKELTDIAAEAESLQPKGYTLETTDVKTPVPHLLKHKLREYQHVGLDWLATMYNKKLNGILADEMGLGKTIQTIAVLAHLACEKGVWGPHLIVVPTSVMLNWEMELKKWCPAFKILTYYGTQKERKQKRTGWSKTNAFHVCITSYKLVIQDHGAFRRKKWKYFILDEAQNIKNFKSQRWQMLLNFSSQRRLLLTGTPLQNSLMELWSLMHFLMPHVFQSHKEFKEWFSNPLTGMVEGSQDYNDGLVKRLHKVLRPFLLRRLKDDVEKQMPKKFEHVVMCRLSKRQRFLYDEFMSQTKTKETLATGHFMSVINVLMQLRKVCNHPNLFDPRPIISPFQMQGIVYRTASLVLKALEYDPFENVDLHALYPNLAEMERDLPRFVAHRIKKLQTSKNLIEEIEDEPDAPPRPKPGKLKTPTIKTSCPAVPVSQSGRSSPFVPISQARAASPFQVIKTSVSCSTPTGSAPQLSTTFTTGPVPLKLGVVGQPQFTQSPLPRTSIPMSIPAQAKVIPRQQIQGVISSTATPMTSQPITVQIQQTEQGTRLMIPTGQLSQLPAGLIQIVQTSSGQQLIATSTPSTPIQPVIPVQNTASVQNTTSVLVNSLVNGPTTAIPQIVSTTAVTCTSLISQVKTTPSIQLPSGHILSAQKPVMRVTPMSATLGVSATVARTVHSVISRIPSPVITTSAANVTKQREQDSIVKAALTKSAAREKKKLARLKRLKEEEKSELFLHSLRSKKCKYQKEKLDYIYRTNKKRCDVIPACGQDLHDVVCVFNSLKRTNVVNNTWKSLGHVVCHCAHTVKNPYHPDIYWTQSSSLKSLVHTPQQYLTELEDILKRFVFVTPTVVAPQIQMHVSHMHPSIRTREERLRYELHEKLQPLNVSLHKIASKMQVQFPELRLIQYDCGKLQTLDVLLQQLKIGSHRVLIFTQMTKMLDILESFLSYHGHRYLRLDGTTRVEQRQILMDRFNMDKRIFCFILSTRSGGLGVNLTGADTVIFYDSDWNPTMDAQAQDRCHRIGQTRDVHIYRLISTMTVEENILKKANQKRLLGDLAIEGGNFTTAFFKENTIKELFDEPSGLEALAKEKERKELERLKLKEEQSTPSPKADGSGDTGVLAQFEQALCKAEDETDVIAAKLVKAEQKAELAEFDETIPWDEREAESKKEEEISKVELELMQLDKELSPIERYAVALMEAQMDPDMIEELDFTEDDLEEAKQNWELARLKALKEEEELRAEIEEDEMLYTYSKEDSNQVFISDVDKEIMPMWAPPTPPKDDNDIYIDQSMYFLYEPNIMTESQLPPVYVRKEIKKQRIETVITRKQKQRKEEQQPRAPRSLFDRPTAALLKMRREAKIMKLKQGLIKPSYRPSSTLPVASSQAKPVNVMDQTPDQPEWLIHEDWALLQAVQTLLNLPLNLIIVAPAHIANWDLVADVVSSCSRVYRSPKQCRIRYETVIIPREEGRILYDISPRKQKKTKGIYKTKNNRPMKTSQLFIQDANHSVTMLFTLRFDSIKGIATKRPPTLRQTLVNPTMKNPKHAAVLQESNITYDQPLNPLQVAANRAERIAREKKQSQAAAAEQQLAAQRTQTQQAQQAATTPAQAGSTVAASAVAQTIQTQQLQPIVSVGASTVAPAGAVQKLAVGQGLTSVSIARTLTAGGNIVVNTQGQRSSNAFAAINKRMSQATPTTISVGGSLTQAVRAQTTGTPLAVHEITTVTTQAQVAGQATVQRAATASGNLTAAQLTATQRIHQLPGTATTVQQQLQAKTLSPQQVNILRQQSVVRGQMPQQQALRTQKLALTTDQLRQPIKRLQAPVMAQQKLLTQPLLTQAGLKQGLLKPAAMKLTEEQMKRYQQQKAQQATQGIQLQIIAQAQVQQVGQSTVTQQSPAVATLVKSVSGTPGQGSVSIPVSINVSMGQQHKTGIPASRATVSQLQQQKLLQQGKAQTQKIATIGQAQMKSQAIPFIIPQQKGMQFTGQLLHQIVKQSQHQGQGATIQQIISGANQPTIIATVTQSQPQMVTKVSLTSSSPQGQVQTISGTSPITVTQVSPATRTHVPVTLNIAPVSMQGGTVSLQSGTATVLKPTAVTAVDQSAASTTVQVHPVQTVAQQKIATISQSLVTQQLPTHPQIQQITAVSQTMTSSHSPVPVQATTIQVQPTATTQQATSSPVVLTQASLVQQVPQPAAMATVVTQPIQQGHQTLASPQAQLAKPSPYAMRTRNQPKH
ncbi:helicase SRCAP-like isoform X2 [Gigantopelta aegis]|uniref:helicase SRCAP-like isoform X2 n=1 Tax=Gigantopelta aegis TaxID=1735272 RepID=UPI001B887B6B|nr:helicase SRCAP-like isoform X2 [Gigantopelta aegis]